MSPIDETPGVYQGQTFQNWLSMLGIIKIPQNPGMEQFGRKNRLGAT